MSRRRRRTAAGMPDCLDRFDWREWRPPAPADHPFPYYVEWYLALHDWQEAKDAWLSGEPVVLPPDRPLPDPTPYTGMLPAKSSWKPPYPGAVATQPVHHKHQPPYPTKESD